MKELERFYSELSEILEVESVSDNENLKGFECWDSLTVLSIIAFADDSYRVSLSANDIKQVETVGELKTLIQSKLS
jgi:acyl carrier protein